MLLQVGDKAPHFKVHDHHGNLISNSSYIGKKWIVFFYPKANTPGCTAEACNLRDHYAELQALGYHIIGVSADSIKKQANFAHKYAFPFPLLADENKQLIKSFGAWGPKKFQGREYEGILRTTFVINEEGIITRVIEKVKTKDHAAQILEKNS